MKGVCKTSVLLFLLQLIVSDFKYFNRIKWQYMVLDEAQAIKSSASQRWKMLLEFKCRNRLLLSGTPIQVRSLTLIFILFLNLSKTYPYLRIFKICTQSGFVAKASLPITSCFFCNKYQSVF